LPYGVVTLGKALGYDRPRDIRKLIQRVMPNILELGAAPQRGALYAKGNGTKGETTEYLLNLGR